MFIPIPIAIHPQFLLVMSKSCESCASTLTFQFKPLTGHPLATLFDRAHFFSVSGFTSAAAPLQETVQVQGLECEMCDVAIEAIGVS